MLKTLTARLFKEVLRLSGVALLCNIFWLPAAAAAPAADLWPYWQQHSSENIKSVDHTPWDKLLKKYLLTNHPSGINRFRYADVTQDDRQVLNEYITLLQVTRVTSFNRNEQKAYWINLYNALTIQVILDHYPVKSITDIDISPGFFSNGPWDARLLRIEGKEVSLNDIEHRILRPIFKDNRLHYALNCASIGCPNLQPTAFTVGNTEKLLETAARQYINSPRGAEMRKGRLHVSSIYKWFQEDFGGSEAEVIGHLRKYARGSLADTLQQYDKKLRYTYDWALNKP
ncbi:MAG: DUF547 domain-containing protein [Desulfobulbaceae bacterium]|nr:DUF547 domain-containing protein [Desulfobulbaceae bacterium]